MRKYIRHALIAVLGLWMVAGTMACNTMKGAGRDIERTGENLQDAAHDAQH